MGDSGEFGAIERAWLAIKDLDAATRAWAIECLRRRSEIPNETATNPVSPPDSTGRVAAPEVDPRIELLRLIDAGILRTNADRIVVCLALLQRSRPDRQDFLASEIHQPLKRIGHQVGNICQQLKSIMEHRRPKWISQSDHSKSGRKRYAITTEGLRAADLLAGNDSLIRHRDGRGGVPGQNS